MVQLSNQGIHIYRHGCSPECWKIFGQKYPNLIAAGKYAIFSIEFIQWRERPFMLHFYEIPGRI
jgi:hypothetical protein